MGGVFVTVVAVMLAADVLAAGAVLALGFCVLFLHTFYFLLRDPY